jgi:hypothetical protein
MFAREILKRLTLLFSVVIFKPGSRQLTEIFGDIKLHSG